MKTTAAPQVQRYYVSRIGKVASAMFDADQYDHGGIKLYDDIDEANAALAERKRDAFVFNEAAQSRMWRDAGRVYPGRAVVYPEDPWGELAGSADTMNPWWVTLAPSVAIESAIAAVTPWDVSLESNLRGTWFLYVFDADGNEVIPEAEYAETTPAAEVIASALNTLNAAR